MHFTNKDHTFAVCAYKESPYLPECIESLGKLLEADPQLELPQHRMLQRYIQQKKNKQTWEKIS